MKTKLRFGCHNVSFSDENTDFEKNQMGNYTEEFLSIDVKDSLSKTQKQVTGLHEILLAFFAFNGYTFEQEEAVTLMLSHNLVTFINDNKKFFDKYFLQK